MNRLKEFYIKCNLREKIFILVLFAIIMIAIVSIITDIIIGYPFKVNIKWLILIILASGSLYIYLNGKFQIIIENLVFISLIFIFLPIGFINSGGEGILVLCYAFLILIGVNIVFLGRRSIIYSIAILTIYLSLYAMGSKDPNILPVYAEELTFCDILINVSLTLIMGAFLIKIVINSYQREHDLIEKYNNDLQEKNEKLKYLSSTDSFINIANRRNIIEFLEKCIDEYDVNSSKSIYVLLFDVDNFKKINDSYGHHIGDEVLKGVAAISKRIISDKDGKAGRYGGDEFLIVLNIEEQKVLEIEEELLNIVRTSVIEGVTFTISGGLLRYDKETHENVEHLMKAVDVLLYHAKDGGRNQIKMI
jgi:diguanylate cyclase (GGDEF)-like protein